jgi:hypothetical protein
MGRKSGSRLGRVRRRGKILSAEKRYWVNVKMRAKLDSMRHGTTGRLEIRCGVLGTETE